MLKKLAIFTIIVLIAVAFLGGYIFFHSQPPFFSFSQRGKSFLKKISSKASSIIYRQATEHNPAGDVLPDELDEKIKEEIKNKF